MDKDKLKLVVSNKSPDSESETPISKGEPNPFHSKFRNILFGVFYFFWIFSLPSIVAISAAIAVGAVTLSMEFAFSILGPAALIFIFGTMIFVVGKAQPIDTESTLN